MQKGFQRASHIMGGRSSSSSRRGFFWGSSFTFLILSPTSSSTLSFFDSASTSHVWTEAAGEVSAGVSDGGDMGLVTSMTEALGIVTSLCLPSSSCLFLSPALTGRGGALEGSGGGSACTVPVLLKFSDKAKISREASPNQDCHRQQNTAADLLSVCCNLKTCCTSEQTPLVNA